MRQPFSISLTLAFVLLSACTAHAYRVQIALSLEKLETEADLICKVVVVSSKPVVDASFDKHAGFAPHATRCRVVAVFKGDKELAKLDFHHYGMSDDGMGFSYMPQSYEFTPKRSYILFAKKTDKPGIYKHAWKSHRSKEDQGQLLAVGEDPRDGKSIKDVFWAELTGLLDSRDAADATYALGQLDQMSGGGYHKLKDFDRVKVITTVKPLIEHREPAVARAAIAMLGCDNPFMSPGDTAHWLHTLGNGHFGGLAERERKENVGAKLYWKDLAAVADSDAPAEVRGLAIRALGGAKRPSLPMRNVRWLQDRESQVRQAAVVLLADYPDSVDIDKIRRLSTDADPKVRIALTHAIGFGQLSDHVPMLGAMLKDDDLKVATAAAASLLSFSLKTSRMTLEANADHPEFKSVFVNALAREDASRHVKQLGEIIKTGDEPTHFWGGSIPWGVSWNLLFKHLQRQPVDKVKQGDFDDALDALESPKYFGSSEPRDLYAFYFQRGMKDRAKKFRAACRERLRFDIDYYFKMVDENPDRYKRM